MKPVDFSYERPRTIAEATSLLGQSPSAKVMAGGQTLGPMLNMRFAQPDLVVDITRIPELTRVEERGGALVLGACVTHAAIEDGLVPDPAQGMLARVAHRIAYRAVRTRGTIGGSLSHADPAADWVSCLSALGGSVSTSSPRGRREMALGEFLRGVLETALESDEIVDGVIIPRLPKGARWGYHKIWRKTGEFADAIGAAVIDGDRCRIVAGATGGRPVIVEAARGEIEKALRVPSDLTAMLTNAGLQGDGFEIKIHVVAVRRAIEEAIAA